MNHFENGNVAEPCSWPRPATPCALEPRWAGEFRDHGDWISFATSRLTGAIMIPMPVDDPLSMAWLDCNDLGNAQRLKQLAKGLLSGSMSWAGSAYDGKRWSARDGELIAAPSWRTRSPSISTPRRRRWRSWPKARRARGSLRVAGAARMAPERVDRAAQACGEERQRLATAAMLSQARTLMPGAATRISTRIRWPSTATTARCASSRKGGWWVGARFRRTIRATG
jgi:hypothetical protein